MKKAIFTLTLFAFSLIGYSQKFYTIAAEPVPSSIQTYQRTVADTVVIDSTKITINCWFGQVGNPYVLPIGGGYQFSAFNQISVVITGTPGKDFYNVAKKYAEAYRQKTYPDIK